MVCSKLGMIPSHVWLLKVIEKGYSSAILTLAGQDNG